MPAAAARIACGIGGPGRDEYALKSAAGSRDHGQAQTLKGGV
jgi:hypothetical protein